LFAKNDLAQQRIRALFAERKVQKIYRALAGGLVREKRVTIARPLDGQTAVTEIRVLNANRQGSYLEIAIHTGRTHQIRKHLLAIGHPLFGEPNYATRRVLSPLERRFRRPMLHALRLGFTHPITGAAVHCLAPLPADFRQGLAWLGLAACRA
jgi:23S rRNA-/tRNA-specific pseudouridylate synthase